MPSHVLSTCVPLLSLHFLTLLFVHVQGAFVLKIILLVPFCFRNTVRFGFTKLPKNSSDWGVNETSNYNAFV